MNFYVKLVLLFFFFETRADAQGKEGSFELKGNITGINDTNIYLGYYSNTKQKAINDRCFVKDGKFYFSGSISEPTVAFISLTERGAAGLNDTEIFLEPGQMAIYLEFNNFNKALLTGSNSQFEYESLRNRKINLTEKYKNIFAQLEDENTEEDFLLRESLTPFYDSLRQLDYEFFSTHPKSYVTLYLLQYHLKDISEDSLALFYNRLGNKLQQNIISKRIAAILNEKGKNYGAIGTIAFSVIAKDSKGKSVNSATYKGKYILLDFWASWCVPCRKNNPHLRTLYSKYRTKGLQIVGVADDSDIEKWKKAINDDKIDQWPQILRKADKTLKTKGFPDEGDINEKFGIETLPTSILINPEGLIIGRFNEDITELEKRLGEIFR